MCEFCNKEFNSTPAIRYHRVGHSISSSFSPFAFSIHSLLDSPPPAVSVTCIPLWSDLMVSEENSVEAILAHLKNQHMNEDLPRYVNGHFVKTKKKVLKKEPAVVLDKFVICPFRESLPSAYSQPPRYSILQTSLPSRSIRVVHNKQSTVLSSSQSTELSDGCLALCTEGRVTSSCLCRDGHSLLLAVSCASFDQPPLVYKRSDKSARGSSDAMTDGLISVYSIADGDSSLVFHLHHTHSYAVDVQWVESSKTQNEHSHGVLSCLYVDGVIELFNVLVCSGEH